METIQDQAGFSSNLSSYSSSEGQSSERGACQHKSIVSQEGYNNCFNCGVFLPKNGTKTHRSIKLSFTACFPPRTIYQAMTKRSHCFAESQNEEYTKGRHNYVEYILQLAEKLRMSQNSAHLAIHILDIVMFKEPSLVEKLQLFTPVCLLVAGKTIELDERIPYLPKLRRYGDSGYTSHDYVQAEAFVFDLLDWNPQLSSALEITEFLMSQGALFSDDRISEKTEHSDEIVLSQDQLDEQKENAEDEETTQTPTSQESLQNISSEASTQGTNSENILGSLSSHPQEDVSPINLGPITKHHSTPAIMQNPSTLKVFLTQRKIEEILKNFDSSYLKLSSILAKDASFIQWEPRVVAASMIAFLRKVNSIDSVWNEALATITCLEFAQISSCFELIYKRYKTVFETNTSILHDLHTPIEQNKNLIRDLNLIKYKPSFSDRTGELLKKSELILSLGANKYVPPTEAKENENKKVVEMKEISLQQPKLPIPASSIFSQIYSQLEETHPLTLQSSKSNLQEKQDSNSQVNSIKANLQENNNQKLITQNPLSSILGNRTNALNNCTNNN